MAEKTIEDIRAQRAVAAAEARLVAQAAGLAALEARATSVIGWTMAASAAVLAVMFAEGQPFALRAAAAGGLLVMASAAALAVRCLAPGGWVMPGHLPSVVLQDREGETEVEFLVSLAEGYEAGIAKNSARLARASSRLRWALRALVAAAPAALLGGGIGAALCLGCGG